MNDYYILQKIGNKHYLYQIVERRMAELPTEIAKRCHEIISEAMLFHRGTFSFWDRESLRASNLEEIKKYAGIIYD